MSLINQLTHIGKLNATHGIKGEFKIWINEEVEIISDLVGQQIFVKDSRNNFDVYTVERFYYLKNKVIVKFEEINSIDEAQNLVHQETYVKTDLDLVEIETTIIGFTVKNSQTPVGKVVELLDNGMQELLKVQSDSGYFWVPNVDRYVIDINWEDEVIEAQDLEMLQ